MSPETAQGSASDEADVARGGSGADDEPAIQHWFEPVADHLGAAYLRYSFTKGTQQEVDFLVEQLGLAPGMRVLAERGLVVHGIDISHRFVELARADAPAGATFERLDARAMSFEDEFDAVICLCQGAFGLMTADGHDAGVLAGMARALRPGGRLALTAFSAYFVIKHWEGAEFDAATGVNHERTEIRNEAGDAVATDLWTGCYTPRELRLLSEANGLRVDRVSSVEPGAYALAPPTTDSPEFLLLATRIH